MKTEILIYVLVLAVIVAALNWVEITKCHAKWGRSGMRAEWTLFAGCLVQTQDGTWIPATNYREMQ